MKKLFIIGWLFAVVFCSTALADSGTDLQKRLDKVSSFRANFSQMVTSADGTMVQKGEGRLWVKRPNLFNWHMTRPDESMLISDGKTLWFYNPFVEQVTATWLKDAADNTPFMLIARNSANDWKQYNVRQQGDSFELTPKSAEGNLEQFKINITPVGIIKSFITVEKDGQRSAYILKGQQNTVVDAAKFTFTIPKGVTLDDQRH